MIPRAMRTYIWLLLAASFLTAVVVLPASPVTDWPPLLLLCAVALVLSSMAVELPFAVSISLSFAILFAALLYSGPVGAGLLGLLSSVSVQEIRDRKPLLLMAGNGAQLGLAGVAAGLVYVSLGGVPLQVAGIQPLTAAGGLLAPLTATAVFFSINLVLVSVGVSLKTGMGPRETVRALGPGSYGVSLGVLALLGFVMAHLLDMRSWAGLLLLILPFTAARRTFRVYVELSEAYIDTVRSLVAAIEAKDPYTRGHSERVAIYAKRLGEAMSLAAADVDLLERAALLHDVGKIGIDLDTLTSPTQLSAEEVRLIRTHPSLGSDLLEGVEFLAEVVPIIRHHHERMDGAGYPQGLSGDDIPLLARALATADAYDAMTSDRAYRAGMTQEQACAEVLRVAGSQLDARLARLLVDTVLPSLARTGIQ